MTVFEKLSALFPGIFGRVDEREGKSAKRAAAINPRIIIRNILVVLVVGSLAFMTIQEVVGRLSAPKPLAGTEGVTPDYFVYYFSVGKECSTCEQIEAFTKETLTTHFSAELARDKIQWREVDMDQPEHEHFATDYNLYTKSIVFVDTKEGRWQNLEDIWEHVYDKPAFIGYIRDNLQAFMEPAA